MNTQRLNFSLSVADELHTYNNKIVCILNILMKKFKNSSGFTLIEIAIVLMVIGLMLGFSFRGQAQIDNTKVLTLRNDFRNIQTYINQYQDKYNTLPGDDASIGTPSSHLKGATPCTVAMVGKCMTGSNKIDGRWNDATTASESYVFWQQIRLADIASGETDITSAQYIEKNIFGGVVGVTNMDDSPIVGLRGQYIICSDRIPGKHVKQFDIALDDGKTDSGSIMATLSGTAANGTANSTISIEDSGLYLLCMGV